MCEGESKELCGEEEGKEVCEGGKVCGGRGEGGV